MATTQTDKGYSTTQVVESVRVGQHAWGPYDNGDKEAQPEIDPDAAPRNFRFVSLSE